MPYVFEADHISTPTSVAPGEGFGPSGAGWARLSLAVDDQAVEVAAERLARAFAAVAA
jgi:bifunctional pyridoxal-dependent enzyme with beta-cystathionase and maltose regulon repressor activities